MLVVDVLALMLDDMREETELDPETIISLQRAVGDTYVSLEIADSAVDAYHQALGTGQRLSEPDHLTLAKIRSSLAIAYQRSGRSKDEVLAEMEQSLSHVEEFVAQSTDYRVVQALLRRTGMEFRDLGRRRSSARLAPAPLAICEQHFPPDDLELNKAMTTLGATYRFVGNQNESLQLTQRALDHALQFFGPDSERVGMLRNNLAVNFYDQGRFDEAIEQMEQAIEIHSKIYGANSHRVIMGLQSVAHHQVRLGPTGRSGRHGRRHSTSTGRFRP